MVDALSRFVAVEVLKEKELAVFKKYDVQFMPTIAVLAADGSEVGRFTGFYPPDEFVEKLSECASADENLKKAKDLLEKEGESAEGLYLRALGSLYKKDKLNEAFSDFDKAAAKEADEKSRNYICCALWKLAETAHLRFDVKTRQKQRAEYLEKLVKTDPANTSGLVPKALYQLGLGNLRNSQEMKKYFDKLKKIDPEDRSGLADDAAFAEALAPYYSKEYGKAAGGIEEFMKKHPGSKLVPQAYSKIALCYYRAKDVEKAMKSLEELVEKYPNSREAEPAAKWLEQLRKQK